MFKKIKIIINNFNNKLLTFVKRLKNPKMFLADMIYSFYNGDKDRIPFPLFNFVLSQYGPWAGFSIYMPIREYQYRKKIRKIRKIFLEIIIPIFIFLLLFKGATQSNDNFFFGFIQNVLSDIFLLILIIYLIPKFLNKPKKYKISVVYKPDYSEHLENYVELIFSLRNIGEEVYKSKEIFWEIFIPNEFLMYEDISFLKGECEKKEELFRSMWRFFGENSSPLFIMQELNIVKIKIPLKILQGNVYGPPKIYYKLLTINGNIPEFENISLDFEGMGLPVDEYPPIGDLPIMDWYDPENNNLNNLG